MASPCLLSVNNVHHYRTGAYLIICVFSPFPIFSSCICNSGVNTDPDSLCSLDLPAPSWWPMFSPGTRSLLLRMAQHGLPEDLNEISVDGTTLKDGCGRLSLDSLKTAIAKNSVHSSQHHLTVYMVQSIQPTFNLKTSLMLMLKFLLTHVALFDYSEQFQSGGAMVSTVTSQQEVSGIESATWLGPSCVEFAGSPCAAPVFTVQRHAD